MEPMSLANPIAAAPWRVAARRTSRGPDARDALAGCCWIDFHPLVFRTGSCAGTLIAKAQAMIAQVDDGPTCLILVRPSYARYVPAWLHE